MSYLFVGPGVSQPNPFDHLPREAGRAGIAAEAGGGVNALDLREAGVGVALGTRQVVRNCEVGSLQAGSEAALKAGLAGGAPAIVL